jgi:hypothetical protein
MKDSEQETNKQQPESNANFVQVAVVTTSGSYPETGFDRTPANQKISVILKKAANKLSITDTTDWIAVVGDKELNTNAGYDDNGLSGQVEIDYGPREGGGGNA